MTIGLVTAAAATIYFVFLIYFDWLRSSFYLPAWRQQLWTSIHLPFHLSLVLFMQGFTQYLIWSKIVDVLNRIMMGVNQGGVFDLHANTTSKMMQDQLNQTAKAFFGLYPLKSTALLIPSTMQSPISHRFPIASGRTSVTTSTLGTRTSSPTKIPRG